MDSKKGPKSYKRSKETLNVEQEKKVECCVASNFTLRICQNLCTKGSNLCVRIFVDRVVRWSGFNT